MNDDDLLRLAPEQERESRAARRAVDVLEAVFWLCFVCFCALFAVGLRAWMALP